MPLVNIHKFDIINLINQIHISGTHNKNRQNSFGSIKSTWKVIRVKPKQTEELPKSRGLGFLIRSMNWPHNSTNGKRY